MDGFLTLGEFFAAMDESIRSDTPAFLEQGETPESELADPTSFIVDRGEFTAGKTALEQEQIQDLWLAVGRDYRIKPGMPTFRKRQRGEGITRDELAEMLRTEAPRVEDERVPQPLGQLPPEMMPVGISPGVEVEPIAEIAKPKAEWSPERVAETAKVAKKKTPGWLVAGGVGAVLLVAFRLLSGSH